MLNESITSSPSKSNNSIHKVRLLRKGKRKQIKVNVQNPERENETNVDKILVDFYKDSENEEDDVHNKDIDGTFLISKPSAIIKNYKPFELEKRLAMADRLTSQQRDERCKNEYPENQEFNTCQTIKEVDALTSLTKSESTSFLITESELINCCYQAEKVYEEKEPTLQNLKMDHDISASSLQMEPSSPNQLVNSILQDFSQSPLTKDQTVMDTSWQHTPEFRFRRKPLKTYSRKCLKRARTNLNKRLESLTSDDGHSNCSSISTQEDVAPLEGVFNGVTSDTSQRLCRNLLNLSAFFSQNTSTNSSPELNDPNSSPTSLLSSSQEGLLNNISSIIHEIHKLRSSYPDKLRTNSYSSNQDFCGFPSQNEEDDIMIDLVVQENEHVRLNNTLIEAILPLEDHKMDVNSDVNNTEYNNQDVFASIKEIPLQNSGSKIDIPTSHKLPNNNKEPLFEASTLKPPEIVEKYDENSTKFMGFKTASSKTIKVSRDAHIVAAKILSKLPDIPNKSKINHYDNCIAKKDSTIEDVNIFKNSDDYEWNDECDFFMNFKTPVVLNEKQHNTEIVKETFSDASDFPSTSKMAMKANIGFQTAAGKNVCISKKAQESVQKLLKEFETDLNENETSDELNAMKMKIFTKTHNNVNIPKTYLQNKQKNGKEILPENFEDHYIEESSKFEDVFDKRDTNPQIDLGNIGFQTAQGKNIKISTKAQQSVEKLLQEFIVDANENFESDLAEMKHKSRRANETLNNNKALAQVFEEQSKATKNSQQIVELAKEKSMECDVEIQQQTPLNLKNGLQTDNGNKVIKSAKAQQCVEKLLNESNTDFQDHFIKDLHTITNDINSECNVKLEDEAIQTSNGVCEDLANIVLSEWPLNNHALLTNSEQHKEDDTITTGLLNEQEKCSITEGNSKISNNCDISSNIGFQTAKGNKVSISVKAQQSVDKLLQEFRSNLTASNSEQSLIDMKSKIELKNKQLKERILKPTESINDNSNMIFSEWPLNNKKEALTQNSTPQPIMGKRKLSLDNSDIPSPITARSPPTKLINKVLSGTKSSFNESTIKSPLNSSPARSVISRKNLLSLTKRRKNKRNCVTNVSQDGKEKEIPKIYKELVATPIKSIITTSIQTPATPPNLKEFFSNAPQTSTPREENKSNHKSMDIDFKPINWDNNNDTAVNKSNHSTKLSDSTCSNISLNSPNPTAKERIARLKMYGKPPASFSPILIESHNSCRPSGLRRTRSMLKKTENE